MQRKLDFHNLLKKNSEKEGFELPRLQSKPHFFGVNVSL